MKCFRYKHEYFSLSSRAVDSIIILDNESFIINDGIVSEHSTEYYCESDEGYLERRVPDEKDTETIWLTKYENYKSVPLQNEWLLLINRYKENKIAIKEKKIEDKLAKIKELPIEYKDIIKNILDKENKLVDDYRSGKKQAINSMVGKIMKNIPGINGRDIVPFIEKILNKED